MSKSSMINHYSPSTVIASPIHGQSWCNYTTPTHHYLADVLKTTSQCWWRRKKFLPEWQAHSLVLSGSGNCLKDIYIFFFSGGDMVSSPESPIGISPLLFLWCEHAHLHFGEWLSQESSGPSLEFVCLFCFVCLFVCLLRSRQPCKQPIAWEWRWPRPVPSSRAFICSAGHTQATLVLINSRDMGKCDSGHLSFSWSICCKLLSHPLDF